MSLKRMLRFASADLAIDLGTANTVVYLRDRGVVLAEPSVVAIETVNGISKVRAVGDDAKLMLGRTPENLVTIRPLRHGVIADLDVAEHMIKHFVRKARLQSGARRMTSPEIVICVPSGATAVERRAIRDAASNAGASRVWLIEEAMAAAIGADLPVTDPLGSMVIDIGGGSTEIGVMSVGGISMSLSERVGGDQMDEAIASYVRRTHNLHIGEATAERIKHEAGSALADGSAVPLTIRGRDAIRGIPREVKITRGEIAEAIGGPVAQIVDAVRRALEATPPEIAADILDYGIVMTGGGSLLHGFDVVIARTTGLAVRVAADPLNCVAVGAGRALEQTGYRGVLQAA
ncbi:MAG: rod shape-determining protein [Croceibacterium sp.]